MLQEVAGSLLFSWQFCTSQSLLRQSSAISPNRKIDEESYMFYSGFRVLHFQGCLQKEQVVEVVQLAPLLSYSISRCCPSTFCRKWKKWKKNNTWSKELHSKWSPHTSLAWAASEVAHVGPRSQVPKPVLIQKEKSYQLRTRKPVTFTQHFGASPCHPDTPLFEPFSNATFFFGTSLSHLNLHKVHLHTPSIRPPKSRKNSLRLSPTLSSPRGCP